MNRKDLIAAMHICVVSFTLNTIGFATTPNDSGPKWATYSKEDKEACLAAGKTVFVFIYAELNPASVLALEGVDQSSLSKLADCDEFGTLIHKYSDWDDPTIRSIWDEVGHTKKPFIVQYSPGQPPCQLDPFTLKPLVVEYNLP